MRAHEPAFKARIAGVASLKSEKILGFFAFGFDSSEKYTMFTTVVGLVPMQKKE